MKLWVRLAALLGQDPQDTNGSDTRAELKRLSWANRSPGLHDDTHIHQNHMFRAEIHYSINTSSRDTGGFFLPVTQSWLDQEIFCLAYPHTD